MQLEEGKRVSSDWSTSAVSVVQAGNMEDFTGLFVCVITCEEGVCRHLHLRGHCLFC